MTQVTMLMIPGPTVVARLPAAGDVIMGTRRANMTPPAAAEDQLKKVLMTSGIACRASLDAELQTRERASRGNTYRLHGTTHSGCDEGCSQLHHARYSDVR